MVGKYRTAADTPHACRSCPSGYYQVDTSSRSCNLCDPGQYQKDITQTRCNECEERTFTRTPGQTSCFSCPAGYDNVGAGQSSCQRCTAGRFGAADGAKCKDCPVGSYQPDELNIIPTTCSSCPRGFYQRNVGSSSCELCLPGRYQANVSSIDCHKCGINNFTDTHTGVRDKCDVCPAGYDTAGEEGQSYCQSCAVGKFGVHKGSTCIQCEKGQFTNSSRSTICSKPTKGEIAGPSGTTSIKIAEGWTKKNGESTPCQQGTFEKNRVCENCPAGYDSSQGAIACQTCDPGKFAPQKGTPSCIDCDKRLNQ